MALGVAHVGGNITTVQGTITSDSWTSTAGSLIVVFGLSFGMTSPAAAGDITDSKGNTYLLRQSTVGGTSGVAIAVYDNVTGTRGASHTVTFNPVNSSGTSDYESIAVIEITGADTSAPYDSTTGAVATDSVTPFAVTAAAAISGNQIALYGIAADLISNSPWTGPAGYTLILQNPDPTSDFPIWTGYKINETGTPTVSSTNAGSLTGAGAREAFVTYKEGSGVTHNGTVAYTEPADVSAAAGAPTRVGTLAYANVADSASITGSIGGGAHDAAVAYTEPADTPAIAGAPTRIGTVAYTNARDTPAIAGSLGAGFYVTSRSGTVILDQNSNPYWIQGASPQNMMATGVHTDFVAYFSAINARGYNAVQVHAVLNEAQGGNIGGLDAAGHAPFGNMATFASPNSAYWAVVDDVIATAAGYGITVFLTVADNISYGSTIGSMSGANATAYGTFLGARYKSALNIVWVVGNDYVSSQWAGRDANYQAIIDAIAAAGDSHIQACWFDAPHNGKENSAWDSRNDLAGIYVTGQNAYTQYLSSLADTTPTIPVFGQEFSYDGEKNTTLTPPFTSRRALRGFSWQAASCGARGAFFGQHNVWLFNGSQLTDATNTASTEQKYVTQTVTAIPSWQTLTYNDSLITGGRGTRDDSGTANYETDNFATAAVTADGRHALCHFPTNRSSVTLAVSTQMASGTKTATWIDPTSGATTTEPNPAAPTMPGNNGGGDPDWILRIDVAGQTATVAVTEGQDIPAVVGASTRYGTVAKTEAPDVATASGGVGAGHFGAVAIVEGADSPAVAGASTRIGVVAVTNARDTASIRGTSGFTGEVEHAFMSWSLAATATMSIVVDSP